MVLHGWPRVRKKNRGVWFFVAFAWVSAGMYGVKWRFLVMVW